MKFGNPEMHPQQEQPKDNYEIIASRETRERLKERVLRFVNKVHESDMDTLVFLDKSTRPFAWMFQEVWKGLYPHDVLPEIKFVNIGTKSHVHEGVSRVVQPIDYRDSEKMRREIDNQEEYDRWISADKIPKSWQHLISQEVGLGNELQSVFEKAFDDKKVLIVDEMGSSGSTQCAALGLFTMSFPKAKSVESISLFSARGQGTEVDRKVVPWLQIPGMAGVLELPETVLQSAQITKENIDKISEHFRKEISKMRELALEHCKDALISIEQMRKDVENKNVTEGEEIKKKKNILRALDELEDLISQYLETKSERLFSGYPFYDARFLFKINYPKSTTDEDARLFWNFDWKIMAVQADIEAIKELRAKQFEHTNIDELKRRTQQLRKEIKKLSQELVDEQLIRPYAKAA